MSGRADEARGPSPLRTAAAWVLGLAMIGAGVGHFVAHEDFLAQTPSFLPARSWIVWISGVVEIVLGAAMLLARRSRPLVGWALALFFVLVFPGNVYQAVAGTEGFGLDTPSARWTRLLFQPLLVVWALWSSGAWRRGTDGG